MKITNMDIIEQVERLAAACPWDKVELLVCRQPEGDYRFTAHVNKNEKFGFDYIFCSEATASGAVDRAIKEAEGRNPEQARKKKIADLKETIERLQSVVIGLPPYRPGSELTNGEASITVRETVDV